MTKELEFIVEGCFRAVHDDPFYWKPVAAFKYKRHAEEFIRRQQGENGESAFVDRMEVRLQGGTE